MAQRVKSLPAMQETQVQFLGGEDPLEKKVATHSSTLAWRIPWREEPGRLLVHGVAKSRTRLSDFTHSLTQPIESLDLSSRAAIYGVTKEGNGNPLQCSCLENPRDGRAWWTAVYGVAQSRTRLKWLSSKESDMTERLKWSELNWIIRIWKKLCLKVFATSNAPKEEKLIKLYEEPQ